MVTGSTTARALVGWVTAVTLLIASTPRSCCVCPDGRLKPFCLGLAAAGGRCCCGGVCCPAAGGAGPSEAAPAPPDQPPGEGCCCCRGTGTEPRPDRSPDRQVDSRCCSKAPAEADVLVPNADKEGAESHRLAGLSPPPAGTLTAACGPLPSAWRLPWQYPRQPPPPDLVTLLQRLTI